MFSCSIAAIGHRWMGHSVWCSVHIVNCIEWHPTSSLCPSTLHTLQKQWRLLGYEENTIFFTNSPWNPHPTICPAKVSFIYFSYLLHWVKWFCVMGLLDVVCPTWGYWVAEGVEMVLGRRKKAVLSWNIVGIWGRINFYYEALSAILNNPKCQQSRFSLPCASSASQAVTASDTLPYFQISLLKGSDLVPGWKPLDLSNFTSQAQEPFLTAFAVPAKSTERRRLFFQKPDWMDCTWIKST